MRLQRNNLAWQAASRNSARTLDLKLLGWSGQEARRSVTKLPTPRGVNPDNSCHPIADVSCRTGRHGFLRVEPSRRYRAIVTSQEQDCPRSILEQPTLRVIADRM